MKRKKRKQVAKNKRLLSKKNSAWVVCGKDRMPIAATCRGLRRDAISVFLAGSSNDATWPEALAEGYYAKRIDLEIRLWLEEGAGR